MTPRSMLGSGVRAASALVACAAMLAGCATGGAGSGASVASAPVDVARYGRLLAMADERRVDTALLQGIFRSGSAPERAAAALAVGQVHGVALAPTLRTLLTDRDTAVASNAAYALGLLADSGSVAALARAIDASPSVGYNAAWALGQIGEPARAAIVAGLAPVVAPNAHTARVQGALLLATFSLKPVPVEAIRPWLADSSALVRWSAVYALARPYAAAGVRDLIPLASDTSGEVRAQVARAFSHRGAGDSLAALVRAPLAALAGDPDPHVRINALRSLATYGAASKQLVVHATLDPDANVRVTAAQEFGSVLDNARSQWMAAWKADTGFMYRRSLLASALSQDVLLPAAERDEPDSWVHQGDWRLRAAVAEAGGASPTILRMREVSLPFSRDPDPRVRAVAFAALAPHADTADAHPWRREYMEFGLIDADVIVRATAIASLEGHATAAEVPLVLESYRLSEADTVNDARLAAVRFFIAAWQHDSTHFPDSVTRALRALPAPADMLTRSAADSFALLESWRRAPLPPSKPASWYEAIVRTRILPALGGKLPRAEIVTVRGTITLELYPVGAPLTVDNFLSLAASHYYDDGTFFRVVPNFVAQDGDHRGDGSGGVAYTIRDELNPRRYERGSLGMALSGPDTGGSQYFMTVAPDPHLDGRYTVFGRVISGFDALDALVQGDHLERVLGL
ncbi:MAG: peptidylprolyl isomerase [Gemmatimonadota bacterium]|nr:peptidylprolyl isomerase [Gemmatimonadota bacterium]